jgi:hypothetical protein
MKLDDEKTWWQVAKWYVIILAVYFACRIIFPYIECYYNEFGDTEDIEDTV